MIRCQLSHVNNAKSQVAHTTDRHSKLQTESAQSADLVKNFKARNNCNDKFRKRQIFLTLELMPNLNNLV